eukprot:CAMPEP_0202869146 /NCGR_PEP_ID=MMETSP1391-20130828/11979_1 /ASSEMBLY_ACC=CAM_ASM_000867 /TAXON_ID=1034604 /ORGANISM="Chlamydomonas leiostraca, Strain SAG 11-49" /LENGTH=82 /DNA_ID=CAMNT_0049549411 /DNA_START=871 /DNA_END=1115 /DNA_ORIENTATION=-
MQARLGDAFMACLLGERFIKTLLLFLTGSSPSPSLVHGEQSKPLCPRFLENLERMVAHTTLTLQQQLHGLVLAPLKWQATTA